MTAGKTAKANDRDYRHKAYAINKLPIKKAFSDKQMHGKNTSEIIKMLLNEKGIDWNSYLTKYKRGSCCIRKVDQTTGRSSWVIDDEIPVFKGEGRKYIDDLIFVGE